MPELVFRANMLTAGYQKDLPILQDVSIEAELSTVTVIIGPNGAGKSTLIKAIAGLVPVFSGSIYHQDEEITHLRPDLMAKHGIAYVPQSDNVFRTLTVKQNLDLALRRQADKNPETLLSQFPVLKNKLHDKAGALSGGQRQFLAIAMALANKPTLLLLDEPSAGLAPKAADEVLAHARSLTQHGVSILLVEQNVNQALKLADHCYILAEGCNQVDGKASDLMKDSQVADIYLGGKRLRVPS